MSNAELAFRLRRLGRRAPQWLSVVADRLEAAQGEPVAWREFDGEGGYDYRSYEGNENFRDEYRARNPGATYWDWVEPLYAAHITEAIRAALDKP